MRHAVAAMAACALVTAVASAQMKPKPAPAAPATPLAVSGAQTQQQAIDKVRRISVKEAMDLFRKDEAVLVDVRSNEQFTLGHIKGAVNIPGSQLRARLKELPPKKLIITYCA